MNVYYLLAQEAHWNINKNLAKQVGINAALLLSDLVSKRQYFIDRNEIKGGWFFNTIENLEKDTFLSAYEQRIALKRLMQKNYLGVKYVGMPKKRWYHINDAEILENITVVKNFNDKTLNTLTSSGEKNSHQEVENFNANNNKGNKNTTKKSLIPTMDEIVNYLKDEKSYSDDVAHSLADEFFSFYEQKNWMVGKNKMSKWKVALGRALKWEKMMVIIRNGESGNGTHKMVY